MPTRGSGLSATGDRGNEPKYGPEHGQRIPAFLDIVRGGVAEHAIQSVTRLVRLLVDKFAARPVPSRQIADRHRSRQRLNRHVLAVIPWHRRCRPDASIHLAPRLKKVRASPSDSDLVNPVPCDLGLNQAARRTGRLHGLPILQQL
jgi:hypothetical protein